MTATQQFTPVSRFGKDHWATLAYVIAACEEGDKGIGQLARSKMRCNPARRPLLSANRWLDSYSTRLFGFFDFPDRADLDKAAAAGMQVIGHDDWDCLDDLEAAGIVEIFSLANPAVRMTPYGLDVCARLREHKVGGGQYAGFELRQPASAAA